MKYKVHYSVHNSRPIVTILSQMNSLNPLLYYFLMIHVKPRLHSILPSGFLTSVFPHQNTACISLLAHTCQMPRQSHGNYICSAMQIIKLLVMLFPHPVVSPSSSLPRNFSVSFQASWDAVTTEVTARTTAMRRIVVDQLLASLYWLSYVDARNLDVNWSQKKWGVAVSQNSKNARW